VSGSRIVLYGVSYKAGVGDLRESPALKIIRLLQDLGADVQFHDEHVPELPQFGIESLGFDESLDGLDAAVIVTAHPGVDWQAVVDRSPLVIDFRGITRGTRAENLVRL
jgi:UDP-N-acetyl-D-glucosamine dehydrogenase